MALCFHALRLSPRWLCASQLARGFPRPSTVLRYRLACSIEVCLQSEAAPCTMTHRYRELDQDLQEFRLLRILPQCTSSKEALQCSIKHASIKEIRCSKRHKYRKWLNEDYEAISYTWGNPTPSSTMVLDGRSMRLPVKSEKALRRMAYPDRSRIVFLSAVCINQADLVERASQVPLMGDIYRFRNIRSKTNPSRSMP